MSSRSLLGAVASLVVLLTMLPVAVAAPAPVSRLSFGPDNPTFDPYGVATIIEGDVAVTSRGRLDFRGRGVVRTPDRPRLDPQRSDFSFATSISLTRGVGNWNIMQKGRWRGSQWKMSLHERGSRAAVSCRVAGTGGAVFAVTGRAVVRADGSWYRLRCTRADRTVRVVVNGRLRATGVGRIGSVAGDDDYLLGSKGMRAADPDQFLGRLDNAVVRVG
jgi:hypothetical protein